MFDVVVIGGGPGGLYTAWCLAKRGFQVALAEEHSTAGQPVHCTGIVAPEAFAEFGLPRGAVLNDLPTVSLFSPSGQQVSYTPSTIEAVVIDRARFDQELHRMAEDAGVIMHMGRKITGVEITQDKVSVLCGTETDPIVSRACILATGASYTLHRQLKLDLPPVYLNSAQVEIQAANSGNVEIYFGSRLAPKGFAWVVPVNRGLSRFVRIGMMSSANADDSFQWFLQAMSARWGLDISENIRPRKRMLPLAPIDRTYGNRLLVVGDAAGLVKPTTGGGIYFSIVTAAIAAELMEKALLKDDLSSRNLSEYEARWRRKLGSELRTQMLLRFVSERLHDQDIDQLFDIVGTDRVMSLIRSTAQFNRHHDLIRGLFLHPATRKILLRQMIAPKGVLFHEGLNSEQPLG